MTDTPQPSQPKRQPRIIRRKKKPSGSSASASTPSLLPANEIPAHIQNNSQLHHVISTTLPPDYEFEIPKTIWRIEKAHARHVALQLPEGLLMYASAIGDILVKFAYRFRPAGDDTAEDAAPASVESLSVLGDVTYGACCIDDLSARALGCDLLVHYGHSCLVPLTCTVVPCLYVFVEIRVDVEHLVECFRLTFWQEEEERRRRRAGTEKDAASSSRAGDSEEVSKLVETLVMGTVQFRSAVVEAARLLNGDRTDSVTAVSSARSTAAAASSPTDDASHSNTVRFRAIVPQAKPLSPGEVLGCTAPSGLAELDFDEAVLSPAARRKLRQEVRNNNEGGDGAEEPSEQQQPQRCDSNDIENKNNPQQHPSKERVMLFLADGRFHLEAAMISNPSLRALRYDPYSKTLTEEKYEIVKMKTLRREAIRSTRKVLGIANHGMNVSSQMHPVLSVRPSATASSSVDDIANSVLAYPSSKQPSTSSSQISHSSSNPSSLSTATITDNTTAPPKTMGIILGTLGRQGNPAILSRIRSLLHSRGIRTIIVLLSEIFPKKLEMISNHSTSSSRSPSDAGNNRHGVCAWVQIACPRLSVDWGHHFCVPVLSPFELFVALGEVADPSLWSEHDEYFGSDQLSDAEEERKTDPESDISGYPMDFYSKDGGPWTNYYDVNKDRRVVSYGV